MGAGQGDYGQLGTGKNVETFVPAQVSTAVVATWGQAAAGTYHTCGLSSPSSYAYCFGDNRFGQLGSGDMVNKNTPTPVNSTIQWSMLAAGDLSTCGLAAGKKLYCWGSVFCSDPPGLLSPGRDPSSNYFSQISMHYAYAVGIAVPPPPPSPPLPPAPPPPPPPPLPPAFTNAYSWGE